VASFADCAHAESLRCGNQLVQSGDTRMEVRKKCGEPGDVVHSTLMRRAFMGDHSIDHSIDHSVDHGRVTYREEDTIVVPVEVWTYNFGAHRFMSRLRFVGGIVEAVETLGYGYDAEGAQ
jgi:Protein of unknown function (DUF2845)